MELRFICICLYHTGYKNEQTIYNMVKTNTHNPIEIIESRGFNRSEGVDARRLNEKMGRAAENLFNLIGSCRILFPVRQVNLDSKYVFLLNAIILDLLYGIIKSILPDVGNGNLHACLSENLGLTKSRSGCAAGYKAYFPGKIFHYIHSFAQILQISFPAATRGMSCNPLIGDRVNWFMFLYYHCFG